jgi:hypothetical protein
LPQRSPKTRPTATTSYFQLVATSKSIFAALMSDKLKAGERAALARALCEVDKRIRAWKGLPEPGQLRHESDPVKGAKKLRGKVLEIDAGEHPDDDAPAAKVKRGPFGRPLAKATPAEGQVAEPAEARAVETTREPDPGSSPTTETPAADGEKE